MALELLGAGEKKCRQHQGKDHHRQRDVADENEEIDRADEPFPAEARIAMEVVVDDVAHEEGAGHDDRREHEFFVTLAVAVFDGDETGAQEHRAGEIQARVERRERARPRGRAGDGGAEIEEPKEKTENPDADDADRGEGSFLLCQLDAPSSSRRFTSASAAM